MDTMRHPGILIALWALLAATSFAQNLPYLREVPTALPQSSYRILNSRRFELVGDRASLKTRAKEYETKCTVAGVPKGSEQAAECGKERANLESEKEQHIAKSKDFNISVERE